MKELNPIGSEAETSPEETNNSTDTASEPAKTATTSPFLETSQASNYPDTIPSIEEAKSDVASPLAASMTETANDTETAMAYAGFWIRLLAALIDSIILIVITTLVLYLAFPKEMTITFDPTTTDLPFLTILGSIAICLIYHVILTSRFGGTVGKRLLKLRVLHAVTKKKISWKRAILREVIGKIISTTVLCLGFLFIALDSKKQGWHDKIGKTVVIKV